MKYSYLCKELKITIMKKLYGSGVALVTPFCADGAVDYTALERLVQYVTDGGISYLVVMGTTAENATLSKSEKQDILSFVVKKNDGKLPIVFGIGGNSTLQTVEDMKEYDLTGVDAILSVVPYYNKPNQQGLYEHFAYIAKHAPLPIILYNVPGRTGVNMCAETTLRLAHEFRNIVAIKEASGSVTQANYIVKGKPEDFLVISGDDNLAVPIMSVGGAGVISVSANAIPKEVSTCVDLCLEGNFKEAGIVLNRILEFQDLIFAEGNPTGVKAAMAMKGILDNNLRLPLVKSSKVLDEKLSKTMKENSLNS